MLIGLGKSFVSELKVGNYFRIHGVAFEFSVIEVIDDFRAIVKIPIELTDKNNHKTCDWENQIKNQNFDKMPKFDQSEVYKKVNQVFQNNEVVYFCPESCSHDCPYLNPLKPGFSIFL